jgi:hypothetical protein
MGMSTLRQAVGLATCLARRFSIVRRFWSKFLVKIVGLGCGRGGLHRQRCGENQTEHQNSSL